jgi:hypothetical protein
LQRRKHRSEFIESFYLKAGLAAGALPGIGTPI